MTSNVFGGLSTITSPIMMIFILILILIGYAVIKVFFANLKRGGILLIQIAVGSLYMFSVPRGYIDCFVSWCKQVIGLCLTAFLQATVLIAGLMVVKDHALLGLGLMLAAGEIPRIAGQFGLDTSTKANLMSTVYVAQTAVNMTMELAEAKKLGIPVQEISAEQIQGGYAMEKKYGVWAMRSAGLVCGAAQSWCKHDGKPIEFDTLEQAESYAKKLNESCYSPNVHYDAKEMEPELKYGSGFSMRM
jgi:hypothetical protein